ncbi:T9SS type A sorting domain-containing protein [bacterium]|nr:T9SS type A sorting domain-containing protein [bacterium]
MRTIKKTLMLAACLTLLAGVSSAQWPTTVEEHLHVAVGPETYANHPYTIPYSADRTFIAFHYYPDTGPTYQIIDRYGRLEYPEPQRIWPGDDPDYWNYWFAVPDGEGGVFTTKCEPPNLPELYIKAQRISSRAELLWGDTGQSVYRYPENGTSVELDICQAGNGTSYIVIAYWDLVSIRPRLYLQRLNSEGEPVWPDSGMVVSSSPESGYRPCLVGDDQGGCYVIWEDNRWPYSTGALYMQRFDSLGNRLWEPDSGRFICAETWFYQVIPDGENGFILQANPGGPSYNTVFRISPEGEILWSRDHVSWYYWANICSGEPGFFYLTFPYYPGFPFILDEVGIYAQRMDIQGNTYWPTNWPTEPGAEMAYVEGLNFDTVHSDLHCRYHNGRLFCTYQFYVDNFHRLPHYLYVQALDTNGDKQFVDIGTLLAVLNEEDGELIRYATVTPDDLGGVTTVWIHEYDEGFEKDLYAKHVNADGSIGGPSWPPDQQYQPGNPFLSVSNQTIHYTLSIPGEVSIEIYNVLGRQLSSTSFFHQQAGAFSTPLSTDGLASGIYFLRLSTPLGEAVQKVAVVR